MTHWLWASNLFFFRLFNAVGPEVPVVTAKIATLESALDLLIGVGEATAEAVQLQISSAPDEAKAIKLMKDAIDAFAEHMRGRGETIDP